MKHQTKKLLDDLLEDSAPAEFHAETMAKTLRSARQRKHTRRFSLALGVIALCGLFVFVFQEMHPRSVSPNQVRPQTLAAASKQSSGLPKVIGTEPDSTVVVVQTSELNRPKEIDDKELVTLLSDQPVALVRYATGRAELVSLNQ
jgi:hypothetical protein